MKRVLVFLAPLMIAVVIFFGVLFFLSRQSGKGALRVISSPQSSIYLGNKLIGTTPLCLCDSAQMLPVGDYTVKLVSSVGNFRSYETKISINKGTLTFVDRTFADDGSGQGNIVSLSPLGNKKDIEIMVVSLPDKANIFLDSNPVGVTPLLLKQVSESDHDLRLTKDGYADKIIKIRTALGFRLSALVFLGVKVDLSPTPVTSISATPSSAVTITKVLILETPTGFLRVRESSSVNSPEIAQVKPGENYELTSEKEGWFEIKLTNGTNGWISSSYATKK